VVPDQLAGLELRHRQHARVEDRIRQAKAIGLRNLPFHSFQANSAWLEIIMAATDLITWTKLIGFADHPGLARCEIDTFRYRVLHVAARITHGARQIRLRIDATWRWAAMGTRDHHRLHPDPRRVHPTAKALNRRDERPLRPLGSPPTEPHRATHHNGMPQSAPPVGQNRQHPPRSGRAKNRG
jgi:hypothetical protein